MAQRKGFAEVDPFPEASLPFCAELCQQGSKRVGCVLVLAAAIRHCGSLWGAMLEGSCWLIAFSPRTLWKRGRQGREEFGVQSFQASFGFGSQEQPICLLRALTSPPLTTCYHTHYVSRLSKVAEPVHVCMFLPLSHAPLCPGIQVHVCISPCGCDHVRTGWFP